MGPCAEEARRWQFIARRLRLRTERLLLIQAAHAAAVEHRKLVVILSGIATIALLDLRHHGG